MIMFIERRWMKTKWLFLISFLLYLLFLILLSTFFGLMYFREGKPPETLTFEDAAKECKVIMQVMMMIMMMMMQSDHAEDRDTHEERCRQEVEN